MHEQLKQIFPDCTPLSEGSKTTKATVPSINTRQFLDLSAEVEVRNLDIQIKRSGKGLTVILTKP